jgi:hypothetical protein
VASTTLHLAFPRSTVGVIQIASMYGQANFKVGKSEEGKQSFESSQRLWNLTTAALVELDLRRTPSFGFIVSIHSIDCPLEICVWRDTI